MATDKTVDMLEKTEWARRTSCPEQSEGRRPFFKNIWRLSLHSHCGQYSTYSMYNYLSNGVDGLHCCTAGTEKRADVG